MASVGYVSEFKIEELESELEKIRQMKEMLAKKEAKLLVKILRIKKELEGSK